MSPGTVLGAASLRRLLGGAALVVAWCALWGALSVANVLSGAVLAVVALTLGVPAKGRGGVRIVPLTRFFGRVVVDLCSSTVAVIGEVLTPTDHTEEGIIAVDLPAGGRDHLLLLYGAITVTPGTAVVAGESDGSVLYLHVLRRDRRDDIAAHVRRLAELAAAALPPPASDRQVAA